MTYLECTDMLGAPWALDEIVSRLVQLLLLLQVPGMDHVSLSCLIAYIIWSVPGNLNKLPQIACG